MKTIKNQLEFNELIKAGIIDFSEYIYLSEFLNCSYNNLTELPALPSCVTLVCSYNVEYSRSWRFNSNNFQNIDKDGKENKSIKNAEARQLRLYCVSNCALSKMPSVRWNGSNIC